MRKLKFRVFDTKNNKWIYNSSIDCGSGVVFALLEKSNIELDSKLTIQQFTGLLDINGKEIYEGDIVQNSVDHPILFEIIYHDKHCAFKQRLINKDFPIIQPSSLEFLDIMKCFVIGNVFENKELIK